MKLLARVFLSLVGLAYVALGLAGLSALYLGSKGLLVYCAFATWFALVAPLSISETNGERASCYLDARDCRLDPAVIDHARLIVSVLCLLSIAGGLAGIWGAWTKRTEAGDRMWHVLVWVSAVVAVWNLEWKVFEDSSSNPFIGTTSMLWAVLYAFAWYWVYRRNREPGVGS